MATLDEILEEAELKMDLAVEKVSEDFSTIRTGRANPQILKKVMVEYYGTMTPLPQLANFSVPEPRMLIVSPYDKSSINDIEKAIRESDLGLNPATDGAIIRCVFPELTEERRKDYIKMAKTKAEDGKVSIRNIRRHAKQALDRAEKDGDVGKDDVTGAEKKLDALTKKHTDAIDEMLKHKEGELLEV